MNSETLTIQKSVDGYEIICSHDQTGSAYGMHISNNCYEQLRKHFVSLIKTMCQCENIEIGSYGNQVELMLPPHMAAYKAKQGGATTICVDTCLAEEVKYLWSIGITTTGCCCGHNKVEPYIGVIDSDIPRMKELGYKVQFNHSRQNDEDSFIPKF